jgi:hypothetical protein
MAAMRRLAGFVLLLQLTSLVSAAGVCVCNTRTESRTESCCVRPSRVGADCCAPDRLTRARTPTADSYVSLDASAATELPAPLSTVLDARLVRASLLTPAAVPQLILRI